MKTRILTTILVASVFIISACNNKWKTYVVKAGQHSSSSISQPLTGADLIEFEFKVNDSWYYAPPANPGWNKIRGISHGHHQNNSSARLGYQCLDGNILVVGGYCYADGTSPQQDHSLKGVIDTVQPGNTYHCQIIRTGSLYKFFFNGKSWQCRAGQDLNWGYLLQPYIGGDFTIDHDWVVEIRDIKQE